jgi:hypothetical protein
MGSSSSRSAHRAAVAATLLLGVGVVWWLKAEHTQRESIRVAQAFIGHVEARQFAQAHELTTKSGYVGATAAKLEEVSKRETCRAARVVGTSPPQSNGNRLRRWALGREVDVPEVSVEFEGSCLLRVTVRRMSGSQWRVSKFASHAG